MTSRHALLPAMTTALVLALATVLSFAGCALPLQGLPGDNSDAGPACANDGQCDDSNPCTIDACPAGSCTHLMEPDGPAATSLQVAFDCQVLSCVKGKPVRQNDDADFQADSEDCTFDTCSNGKAFHTPKPDETACTMGSDGVCEGGKCMIICTKDDECHDNNPCTQDSCDLATSTCSFSPLNGVNTPGVTQTVGDCQVEVCVDGTSTKSHDDSDLPKTDTDCDQELCTNGTPSNPPLGDTVTCGAQKDRICDGAGACVECNAPSQCPGIDSDCQARSCTSHVCGITYSPLGTARAASFQMSGDCKVVVCDGNGNSAPQPQNDDNDVPGDGNNCTKDVCAGGSPSHPFEPMNAACGVNSACNATGQCGCANDAACTAPNTCGGGNPGTPTFCGCTLKSCAAVNKTCGTVTDGCFSTQSCDNSAKDGTETDVDCGGGGGCGAKCAAGKQCSAGSDCGTGNCADGVCCNTACAGTCQACTTAKKGGGADGVCGSIAVGLPDSAPVCGGTKACDGANNCKKVDGQTCAAGPECVSGSCADGVCCNTTCNGTCLACTAALKGSGNDGVCGNIPINLPDTSATTTCAGTSSCDGNGVCKKNVGQPCGTGAQCVNGNCVDGACCGSASCGTCQSCNLAGNAGTCTNITSGNPDTNPANTCTNGSVCDGGGMCKKVNGQTCAINPDCVMGNCVDGVCCNSPCTATCKACNVAGSLGACTNITAGNDDTSASVTCTGTSTCDGNGGCKKSDGQACVGGGECLNGNCIDGICCNTTCTGTCKACNVAGSLGVCSNIVSGQTDTNAATTCVSPSACDGNGACKKNDGQTCGVGGECVHGNCADGVCCNTSCQGTCMACDVAGSLGTCSNIPVSGTPDNNAGTTCSGSSACDGMGNCKLNNGQTCSVAMPGACLSNICADNVCCDVACGISATCKSCNQPATLGTCSTVMNADDADSCLPATTTCSATGACLTKTGLLCVNNSDCASGNCGPGPTKVCQ